MSKLAQLLTPRLPEGMTIPEPLEQAWAWMEANGWAFENRHGYFVTPYAGTAELGIVFSPTESLAGWFEPDDAGFDRLLPIGQTDGTGGFAAIWNDPAGQQRFVLLGSEGERLLLAEDAVDFLRLLAVGYLELNGSALPQEPDEDEDAESVEALAEFRAWVEAEFGVVVPASWRSWDPDPFDAWVGEVKHETAADSGAAAVVVAPSPFELPIVEPAKIVAACEELLDEPRIGGIRFSRLHGLRRTTAAWGHELELINVREPSSDEETAALTRVMDGVRSAFAGRWGAPRNTAPVRDSWVANKLIATSIDDVELWTVSDDAVVALFTSASEGSQIAAVISHAAADEPAAY